MHPNPYEPPENFVSDKQKARSSRTIFLFATVPVLYVASGILLLGVNLNSAIATVAGILLLGASGGGLLGLLTEGRRSFFPGIVGGLMLAFLFVVLWSPSI